MLLRQARPTLPKLHACRQTHFGHIHSEQQETIVWKNQSIYGPERSDAVQGTERAICGGGFTPS